MHETKVARYALLEKASLPADGGSEFNRLIFSKSPYLLQHADNPVDWYEWGDEPFARATAEHKPVFLSIGYATCHWCHVMAHESFADPAVAAVLNRHFIAIKVDREERPDLDDQYMAVSQILTGSGGWPLNLFLTPDRHPFYATTYLPKTPRYGTIGFVELLERITDAWEKQPDRIATNSAAVLDGLRRLAVPEPGDLPGPETAGDAYAHLKTLHDPENGGFGRSPKFPMPVNLQFLLRYWRRSGDAEALRMVSVTLEAMAAGGIHDQLGGGFHRYSLDRQWLVPHFEKMLYDQALLASIYLEGYQATGKQHYCQVAEGIFAYLERDLSAPVGAFYSAEDADSEGEEGLFYVWTPEQLAEILGGEAAVIACQVWGVTASGNFEGRSILHCSLALEAVAADLGIAPDVLRQQVAAWRQQLLQARAERVRPLRDDKILAEWNGLAIAALAKGYAVTGKPEYLRQARDAYTFVAGSMVHPNGRLMRRWFLGDLAVPALLDDYAALLWGAIELHQATLAAEFLAAAGHWARELVRLFKLPSGACSAVGPDAEQLLVQTAVASDGVIPPGNALTAACFLRLAAITGDDWYAHEGQAILRAFAGSVARQPAAYLGMLMVGEFLWPPAPVVTLAGGTATERVAWLRELAGEFLPGLVVREEADHGGGVRAEFCAAGSCWPIINDLQQLIQVVGALR
jgi:uncharacterized protein